MYKQTIHKIVYYTLEFGTLGNLFVPYFFFPGTRSAFHFSFLSNLFHSQSLQFKYSLSGSNCNSLLPPHLLPFGYRSYLQQYKAKCAWRLLHKIYGSFSFFIKGLFILLMYCFNSVKMKFTHSKISKTLTNNILVIKNLFIIDYTK